MKSISYFCRASPDFKKHIMKTAIVYYSKHGTTQKVAHLIGNHLNHEIDYISLKTHPNLDIESYDKIILGTPIYAGSGSKLISQFCHKNRALLEQKSIGLFICCMNPTQEVEQMANAFPQYLHRVAITEGIVGGEFLFDKMNFMERFITKRIAKIKSSTSNLRYDVISDFANKMK